MSQVGINVKKEVREVIEMALEEHGWNVEDMISLLANEIKYVALTYEND